MQNKYWNVVGVLGLSFSGGCAGDTLIDTQVQLSMANRGASAIEVVDGTSVCEASATTCTPNNLAGRIFSANAMWGELGPDAFAVTMLGANDDVILDPSHGIGGELDFSLIESTVLSGKYAAPPVGTDAKVISRMEFNYDYLDAELAFDASAGAIEGTYVVRTVFVTEATAPDVEGTMVRGDKLIRRTDEENFQWCTTSGCSASRDAVVGELITEEKLVNYEFPGEGNPNYTPFTVPLANELMLTGDELNTPNSLWSVRFDMTDAILFHTSPGELNGLPELLQSFELSYEPDQAHQGEETAISANLEFVVGEGDVAPEQP